MEMRPTFNRSHLSTDLLSWKLQVASEMVKRVRTRKDMWMVCQEVERVLSRMAFAYEYDLYAKVEQGTTEGV